MLVSFLVLTDDSQGHKKALNKRVCLSPKCFMALLESKSLVDCSGKWLELINLNVIRAHAIRTMDNVLTIVRSLCGTQQPGSQTFKDRVVARNSYIQDGKQFPQDF